MTLVSDVEAGERTSGDDTLQADHFADLVTS